MPTWNEFVEWALPQATEAGGRKALRRRWMALQSLADEVAKQVSAQELQALLGKRSNELDPEQNDLKALVAYGAGRGILKDPKQLQEALRNDTRADPLYFLAQHSGKTFGEKYAPLFAKFWLAEKGDQWEKQSSKQHYDVCWIPRDLNGKKIRIELKASSEYPSFLFQQIRHPRLSGGGGSDYDLLLCVGVSAGSLDWWAIPSENLEQFAETGSVPENRIVITRHHGKRRPIWNDALGYTDEGWFRADDRARKILEVYACDNSEALRAKILSCF